MTQLSPTELAQLGEPGAIASLLNLHLQPQGISVSVDREDTRLSIGLYTTEPIDRTYLVNLVKQQLRSLQLQTVKTATLFGYRTGDFTPGWSYRISLEPMSVLSASDTSLGHPQGEATANPSQVVDHFLVCGLGSLGQYCVYNLTKFASSEVQIHITAIDRAPSDNWEVDNLPEMLAGGLIIGNYSKEEVLLKAGIQRCRSVLIVGSDENDNIQTAIIARRLNAQIGIVVRSSRQNLNQLLKQQLGNFLALEPTELPAGSFALTGLDKGTLGLFQVGDRRLRVVEQAIQPGDYRFDNFPAYLLHRKTHRLLTLAKTDPPTPVPAQFHPVLASTTFFQWQPQMVTKAGDWITFIEIAESSQGVSQLDRTSWHQALHQIAKTFQKTMEGSLQQKWSRFWNWMQAQQIRQIVSLGLLVATVLWALGAIVLKFGGGTTWKQAVFASVILLLGGYGDVFGGLNDEFPIWVMLIELIITLASLLFVLGVIGLVADHMLSSRLTFFRPRIPIPKRNHIVLIGLGRIGQRVAALLKERREPLLVITDSAEHAAALQGIPVLIGDPIKLLAQTHLATARSVIAVTDDQMVNLEAALIARNAALQTDREVELVIRTYDQAFSDSLMKFLPDAKALCAYALSAEAFVGAAFGENILGLFRLNQQTVLVVEYCINRGDTLVGKLLAEVAYGYGVVPIFHGKKRTSVEGEATDLYMPPDERRLDAGDRFVVLSTINGLRRIEQGERVPPRLWQLTVQKPLNAAFLLESGNNLSRISGCELKTARAFMQQLPGTIELPLYDFQAFRLQQELGKQLSVSLKPLE
jgi:Trk K+ transport system NAD-binding subunit